MAGEIYEMVFSLGGTRTAEHGMGRLRSPFVLKELGSTVFSFMRNVKEIFDPAGIANHGAIFTSSSLTDNVAV